MDERLDLIKRNTQMVIEQLRPLSGIEFGLNRDSVEWVDGFIQRQRVQPDFDPNHIDTLVSVLGSFLGECIIANAGGEWYWSDSENAWSVAYPGNNHAYPFAKVRKLFEAGREGGDSILGFYDVVVDSLSKGKLLHLS